MMTRVEYLNTHVFPRAVANGAFGPDALYESFEVDSDVVSADHFASDIVFGTVKLRDAEPCPVVIKFKNTDPIMSAKMNMHEKFYNEYVFYSRLLPELARRAADPEAAFALFPRFVYSNVTHDGGDGDDEQVIVVASITPAGYRMPEKRIFLDVEHVLLALRKLGTLHGLSYNAKAHPDGLRTFIDLTAVLVETQWFDGYWYKSPRFLSGTGNRGLNALRNSEVGGEYADRLNRIRALLDGNSETMTRLLRPVEPMAVLCHGDYCRNNMMFRYDADTGRPVDMTMIDPAQARYASPAIDLSFFLYMNTTDADRLAHWDDYVAAYLAGVADVAADGCAALSVAEDVHNEMREYVMYGYAYCSFFLPAMINTKPPDVENLATVTDDELIDKINECGGPDADRLLASIVKHMVDRRYL